MNERIVKITVTIRIPLSVIPEVAVEQHEELERPGHAQDNAA